MLQSVLGILGAFAAALLLVALTFSATHEVPADFVFVNGAEPRSLDPAMLTTQAEGRLADALFEGLTRRARETLEPAPGLASSWEVSPDGLTYTFHLRPDAVWSDGRPLTAHDVAWSWRRLEDPALGAPYAYLLYTVRGAEARHAYGGHAHALIGPREDRTPIARAVAELGQQHPAGVSGDVWRAFVKEEHLAEVLRGVEDARLLDALAFAGTRLAQATLQELAGALEQEGERRQRLHAEAEAAFGRSQGVYATDEHTLVVELESLTPYFLELTSFYPTFPVPRHLLERPGRARDWFLPATLVSNGPFRLAAWRVHDKIRLVRSETYWGAEEVGLGVVDALPTSNATTALNLYLTGAADWVSGMLPQDLLADLEQRPDFYSTEGLGVYFYRFNCTRPPFQDARVRQAFCLAVDRRPIVDHVVQLGNPIAHLFVPPALPGYEGPESAIGFDPERARALLAEAGHESGGSLGRILLLYRKSDADRRVAENLAWQLRENLGADVLAYSQETQAYYQSMRSLDYDLVRSSWIGDYVDPSTFLDVWVTGGGNNRTGWSNVRYDRWVSFASDVERFLGEAERWLGQLREPDRMRPWVEGWVALEEGPERVRLAAGARAQLLREAEAILVQEGFPFLPLYFYVWSGLVRGDVTGFPRHVRRSDGSVGPNLQDLVPLYHLGRAGPSRQP